MQIFIGIFHVVSWHVSYSLAMFALLLSQDDKQLHAMKPHENPNENPNENLFWQ